MINPKTGNKISEEDVRGLEALDEYLKEKRAELDILEIKSINQKDSLKKKRNMHMLASLQELLEENSEEELISAVGSLVDLRDYV